MKQYARFTCSTCFRSADRLVETKRASIDKCSITNKCTGRMSIVGYLNNAMILPAVVSGLENWRPRWETNNKIKSTSIDVVDTSTSALGSLVLAIQLPASAPAAEIITVTFNQQDEKPKEYKQFMFRYDSTFQIISGVESGLDKKALRYSAKDDIDVYVNGVIQEEGSGPLMYQRYNGTNAVPQNTIIFNTLIDYASSINQVDVIVSKTKDVSAVTVPFTKNTASSADTSASSWKNVRSVRLLKDGQYVSYLLYHFDVLSDSASKVPVLKKDSMLVPASISMNNTDIALSRAFILFANKPYLNTDRLYASRAGLDALDNERDYLKFVVVNGTPKVLITSTSITDVYPPLIPDVFVQDPIITAVSNGVDQIRVHPSIIIGPTV